MGLGAAEDMVRGPGRIKARRAAVRILGTLMAFYEQVEKEAKP